MASIKLKHSSGNSTILNSPAANPTNDVTLKLPSTTGSAGQVLQVASANHSATNAELEFAAAAAGGITMADSWRLTTSFQGNAIPITSNWERSDNSPFHGYLGTGMPDPVSGIFTFPSTGWYFVITSHYFYGSGNSSYNDMHISVTNDNGSNWTSLANSSGWADHVGTTYQKQIAHNIIDITNVSNQKIRFTVEMNNSAYTTYGGTSQTRTGFDIFKLGDT